jgi:hypothetical protein
LIALSQYVQTLRLLSKNLSLVKTSNVHQKIQGKLSKPIQTVGFYSILCFCSLRSLLLHPHTQRCKTSSCLAVFVMSHLCLLRMTHRCPAISARQAMSRYDCHPLMFGLGVVATWKICLLLPPSMSSRPTFCDLPISTIFDDSSASSYISLDWVMSSGLRTSNSRASGRLTLPCDDGTISVCMNDIPVAAALPSDLVLGLDWFYSLPDSGSRIIVHLSCGSLDLQCPLPAIGLESGSSSSSMSAGAS